MTDFKKMMPVILLITIFVVGLPFVAVIMGSTDAGVDLSGTDYEDQYNSTTDVSQSSIVILQTIPYIFVALMLILAVMALVKVKNRL